MLYLTVSTLALVPFPRSGAAPIEKNQYSQLLVSILKLAYYQYLAG